MTRQIKAVCRRIASTMHPGDGNKVSAAQKKVADAIYRGAKARHDMQAPDDDAQFSISKIMRASQSLHGDKLLIERKLRKLAKSLPIYTFVEQTPGFGDIGLAQIVGKCGDLSGYSNPAKVWKRMGLGLVDGKRQQRIKNDKALAIRHGYSPRRRSTMFVIGDSLLKCQGPYREVYLQRKEREVEKAVAAGLAVVPQAEIDKKVKKGAKKEDLASQFMSQGHIHARAQRYMEKRLLRDLWAAWKKLHGVKAAVVH